MCEYVRGGKGMGGKGKEGEESARMGREDGEKRKHLKTRYRDRWLLDLLR